MKKCTLLLLCLTATFNIHAATSAQFNVKSQIVMKNTHGAVPAGTWFNLTLEDAISPTIASQNFKAKLTDPIYNKDFSEVLIPANSIVTGTYTNNGKTCAFNINRISFKGTDIDLESGAYSTVDATLPNQPECSPNISYSTNQPLEFKTKVDIEGLEPVQLNKDYYVQSTQDNFVEAYGNSEYMITKIQKFTNGLMEVSVKFNNKSIKDKLVPIYFDEFGLPHCLNFTNIITSETEPNNDSKSYLVLSHYNKFGFGVLEE